MHRVFRSLLRTSRVLVVLGLAVLLGATSSVVAAAQTVPFIQRVFETLIALPDEEYLAHLVDLAAAIDESDEARGLLMEAPRAFLMNEGIDLAPDEFQISVVDFTLPPAVEDEPWFGIAEPLEGRVFEPKGVGVFYRTIAVFIQEAHEPLEGPAEDRTDHQTDMLRFIGDRFPGDTGDQLRAVVRELEELAPDDPRRLEFLDNPREYLNGQGLTLPAYSYRIIAIDLLRAGEAGGVVSDEIRAGLAVVPEGVGVFYESVGIFLQRAV